MARRKRQIHRKDRPRLEALGREGLSDKAIAGLLRMTLKDLRAALKADPQSEVRLLAGRAEHEREVLARLHAIMASGAGQNVTAGIFLAKAAAGLSDKPPAEPPSSTTNVTIQLPGALPLDRYTKEVTAQVERARLTDGEGDADADRN